MPRLSWSKAAVSDVKRLHAFLEPKNRDAAKRAVLEIDKGMMTVARYPEIGRPIEGMLPNLRERVIPFGQRAYVVLYSVSDNEILILAVRHGREDWP